MSRASYLGSQPEEAVEVFSFSLVETWALNKCLLGELKHKYKMKSLKGHYTITWWRTKVSKKRIDYNKNENDKKIQTANCH